MTDDAPGGSGNDNSGPPPPLIAVETAHARVARVTAAGTGDRRGPRDRQVERIVEAPARHAQPMDHAQHWGDEARIPQATAIGVAQDSLGWLLARRDLFREQAAEATRHGERPGTHLTDPATRSPQQPQI